MTHLERVFSFSRKYANASLRMEGNAKKTKGEEHEPSKAESRGSVRRRIPLKMFGKKFSSKRLLVSSKVWMQTIPTQDCDIVLTLPATTSDTTLMWLLARLRSRAPHISVHFRHHNSSGIYGLYMTASYESLLQGAEELGIRKPLKSEFGGGIKEFVLEDQECFEGVGEEETFLTSQERQSIVHHMLNDLRATEGEELNGVRFVEGQPIVPRLASKNVVSGVFPLHCQRDLIYLRQAWVLSFLKYQPLDSITEYFGVKIGMYFAFLGHYTKWLVFPAFLGVVLWLLQGTSQWWEDVNWVMFSIVNVLWATLYIINWKRTGATLAYRWGTLDKKDDLLKDPRPLFKGDLQKSPVTGHLEPYYPAWKRNLFRYCISTPIILLFLLLVFYVMLLIFELQEWVNRLVVGGDIPCFLRFGPKVLMAVVIAMLDEVYKTVAIWLNNKENHRLEETHETNLVIKLVLFQFVNSFLSLFYIAFYLRDMDRLRETLAALLITRQILGNLKEVLLPLLRWKGRLYTMGYKMAGEMSSGKLDREVEKVTQVYRRKWYSSTSSDPSASTTTSSDNSSYRTEEKMDDSRASKDGASSSREGKEEEADRAVQDGEESFDGTLTQAEVESIMTVYDNAFEDYLEMCIQFGYVTLFSSAFPLAALCGLLNNLIEIRSDAFKLCYTLQRPFGVQVEDIGIWQDVLQMMVLIAVIVNSVLIGMGDLVHRMLPALSDTLIVVLVVVVEHVILGIKQALEYAIPDVPHKVATEMAKVEFERREALKRLEFQGNSSTERSPRSRAPDSPSPAPDSPVPTPRRLAHTPTSPPLMSRGSHHSLISHRPHNYSANNSQEDRQRGGNPWGPAAADCAQGSPPSHPSPPAPPYRDNPKGNRRLPSVPTTDDRFRNPFEAEVHQIFRQTSDVLHVYRKSESPPSTGSSSGRPAGSSSGRPASSGDRPGPGNSPRPGPTPSLSRAKSLDSELSGSRRDTASSVPQSSAQRQTACSVQRNTVSMPREMPSQPRGEAASASPPLPPPAPRAGSCASRENVQAAATASVVRRRVDGQPASPTAVGLLAGESCVDSAGHGERSSK
ncbi:anoctamin-8-like isoform X2 [Babylonia areolata]|uniref:anoctamin-8-like isoform X2 n=1 Tax=Babylonia areolata TaxID=304850 RepID=UPI003FCF208F